MVQLSVIIPFRNAASTLPQCLDALRGQDLPAGSFEVIAIDNNSTDSSVEIVRRYAEVTLLDETAPGAYAARNRGVVEARGRILVFTDPDCVAQPNWLSTIQREMTRQDTAILLGGYVLPRHSRVLELLVCYENTKDAYVYSTEIPELYYGHTNNMAIRRDVFDRFGPFVQRLRGADTIFVRRVVGSMPCSVARYCPTALVDHLELRHAGTYFQKMTVYGESRESYREVSWTRPLTLWERVVVFSRTRTSHSLSITSTLLLCTLLVVGLIAWRAGRARAQWRRLRPSPPGSASVSSRTPASLDSSSLPR